MKKLAKICNCCGSRSFVYDKKTKQYICDYCKNSYEPAVKPEKEKKEEPSEGHMATREIVGILIGLIIIVGGICLGIYIANSHKEDSKETEQVTIQEPVVEEIEEPEAEPTGNSAIDQSISFAEKMMPIVSFPLVLLIISIVFGMVRRIMAPY